MGPSAEPFHDQLATDEPVNAVAEGTLIDDSTRERVTIGLTDRRFLGIADDGGFMDVGYDAICSIRGRIVSRLSIRADDYRFLTAVGGPLALVSAIALIGYVIRVSPASNAVTIGLALATVVGIAAAVFVKRQHDANMADRRSLTVGAIAAGVAILAFAGLFSASGGIVIPSLVLLTIAGLALADYARRHRADFGDLEVTSVEEKAITVNTVDGRSVRILVESDADIDRQLSRLASLHPTARPSSSRVGVPGRVHIGEADPNEPGTDELV